MLTLRTLGSASLRATEGEEIGEILSQPKRFAVLAFMAVTRPGGFHRRDTLLAAFWPEQGEGHARNALSQSLRYLRRNLPAGTVVSRGKNEVGINADLLRTDVAGFEAAITDGRWADALDLYRGGFLEGFHVADAPGFEEWSGGERERLREAAAGAAWSLAGEQIRRGALVEAERTAQKAMDLVCTDESPVRGFIEALARAGDRAAALNFYERFNAKLRDKLDLDPSPETREVAEGIRNGCDAAVSSSTPGAPWVPIPQAPSPASTESGPRRIPSVEGPPRTVTPDPARQDRRGGPTRRRNPVLWAIPGLAAVSLAALWISPSRSWEPDPDLVAVAPFRNRTGDPGRDEQGAVAAANIQLRLDRAGIGEVASLPMVEYALLEAGPDSDPVSVLSRQLGAGVVVTGDLFRQGDSLLVRAYCIDSRTGRELHPVEKIHLDEDGSGSWIPEVGNQVAAILGQHFDTDFAVEPGFAPPPASLEAYREFRRGHEVYRLGGTHKEAMVHFRRAWEMDPSYLAPPLRLLALTSGRPQPDPEYAEVLSSLEASRHRMTPYQRHYFDGIRLATEGKTELAYREFLAMSEMGRLQAASSLAEMALRTNRPHRSAEAAGRLEKGNGEFLEPWVEFWQGYWSLYTYALHLTGDFGKELEIALAWRERWPTAVYYPEQAQAKARIGLGHLGHLDPFLARWRTEGRLGAIWDLADELRAHGYEGPARQVLEEEVLRFETDSAYIGRFNNQAMVLHRLGRNEEAHALWEQGVSLERPDPWPWGVARIGFSAALIEDTAQAREMERLLLSLPAPQEPFTPFLQAQIAAALGEKDRAVRILEAWARKGTILFWLNTLHRDFTLQSLLGDHPGFQELMRPKG